jgi:hypothetical protein
VIRARSLRSGQVRRYLQGGRADDVPARCSGSSDATQPHHARPWHVPDRCHGGGRVPRRTLSHRPPRARCAPRENQTGIAWTLVVFVNSSVVAPVQEGFVAKVLAQPRPVTRRLGRASSLPKREESDSVRGSAKFFEMAARSLPARSVSAESIDQQSSSAARAGVDARGRR